MLKEYIDYYSNQVTKPRADWKIVKESPATATIDADTGLAIILGPKAMKIAIEKAKKVGIGMVTMRNAGHSGAIGHHALIAAKEDMVGMCMTAGGLRVVPTFSSEPLLGTNPIAVAAPTNSKPTFLFDAATCSVAANKVRLAQRSGEKLMPGWVADQNGTPLMEECKIEDDIDMLPLLPLGGTREIGSHKGYGLSLVAEIMCSLMSGGIPSMLEGHEATNKHFFAAYNISAFTDLDEFKKNMDDMLGRLIDSKPAPGFKQVLYPGLPEFEDENDRLINGIPLHKEVVEFIQETASRLEISNLV
jgi:LDH2 family malate/lactate/ureidoglycolate dehydrogenase